jgi:hypothetical protein
LAEATKYAKDLAEHQSKNYGMNTQVFTVAFGQGGVIVFHTDAASFAEVESRQAKLVADKARQEMIDKAAANGLFIEGSLVTRALVTL